MGGAPRLWACSVAVAALLALPASATAAETIGASLPGTGGLTGGCQASPIGLVHDQLPVSHQAPGGLSPAGNGVITRWRIETFAGAEHFPIALRVYTPNGGQSYTGGPSSARVPITDPPGPMFARGLNQHATRLPIEANQVIGIDLFTDAVNDCFNADSSAACGSASDGFTPPLGAGATGMGSQQFICIPLNADVEPDADRDGFGDETQDACPADASTQAACPPPCKQKKGEKRKRCLCKQKKGKKRKKCLKRLKKKGSRR